MRSPAGLVRDCDAKQESGPAPGHAALGGWGPSVKCDARGSVGPERIHARVLSAMPTLGSAGYRGRYATSCACNKGGSRKVEFLAGVYRRWRLLCTWPGRGVCNPSCSSDGDLHTRTARSVREPRVGGLSGSYPFRCPRPAPPRLVDRNRANRRRGRRCRDWQLARTGSWRWKYQHSSRILK